MDRFTTLKPEQLKNNWPLSILNFNTTEELNPICDIIGQDRAIRAMEFGTRIGAQGYNIFITGLSGTGKTTYAKEYVASIAANRPVPDDWCYVYNFDNPGQPLAIRLPSKKGKGFADDMRELLEDIKTECLKVFGGREYENEKTMLFKETQEIRTRLFAEFNENAQQQGFQVNVTNSGMYFTPIINNKALDENEYNALDDETKKAVNEGMTQIQLKAVELTRRIKELEKESRHKAKEIDNRIGLFAVGLHIDDMKKKYVGFPQVVNYFNSLMKDVLHNIEDFKDTEHGEEQNPLLGILKKERGSVPSRYMVNLFVDNSETKGAPVKIEYNPTYQTLFGQIEYESKLGAMVTDFTMIKSGSIHLANGGYMILQAKDILTVPFAWESLKKIIKTKSISIESLRDQFGLFGISGLKPEPIPIDVKIILVGNDYLFSLLSWLDEDFSRLFRVKVDFDDEMEASAENLIKLAQFISGFCKRENIRHCTPDAVLSIADYSCRLSGSKEKFSTRFNQIVEVLLEADSWAEMNGGKNVCAREVLIALNEKEYRSNELDRKLMEHLKDGTIMLDTKGGVVGQINGLSIINTGDFVFGKPSRITATTYMGRSGIVNIERELHMSGAFHSKGVMILSAYIGERYAQEIPLALTANITFEQTYSTVDGDSASSTELYAILSSLAKLPINQGVAVTGSVNQKGEIQPVGGVTQKIEGFFSLCKARGLTGDQGVIIPHQNVKNLVLKDEIIDAVREKKFSIYPVRTVDEGLEILMGIPAGIKLQDGHFEKDTVHEKVYNRLRQYALFMVNFGKEGDDKEK